MGHHGTKSSVVVADSTHSLNRFIVWDIPCHHCNVDLAEWGGNF
jgi:hypothetical protein